MFGLMLRTEQSVMGVSMLVLFPLTFASNIFVDPATMPGWLQAFVEVQPDQPARDAACARLMARARSTPVAHRRAGRGARRSSWCSAR